jgi:hypothetical protein
MKFLLSCPFFGIKLKHFRGLRAAYDNGCFVIVAGQGRGCWLKFQGNSQLVISTIWLMNPGLLLTWLGTIKHGVCKRSYLSKKHTFDAGMQLMPFSGTSPIGA